MEWNIKKFTDLSNKEMYELLKARVDVFVVEQNCPYPELDNLDQQSIHYFLKVDGEIAANVRLLPKGLKYEEAASIGRVLVVEKFRGNGFAHEIMKRAIRFIEDEWNEECIKIQAQEYLNDFYGSHGFDRISDTYLEDGIPHIDMLRKRN
ncbi:GNAT family N-acetyltransferase [Ornithinibacillus halophilus]|uniref:ElaA protein n=1 Tax=Ornithinibacillus halophilus TaxID=930117 RepID=A0A1M5GYC1_9BACI|nr:GNAT family N-acetyltransferase [Ornithinibacillus halophilus]SHG08677.1 ElaA protein [Ornithinibacillus halophilus]